MLLAPLAPHFAEELWERTGHSFSIHTQMLPGWDESLVKGESVTIVVQVNGKVRARMDMPADAAEDEVANAALAQANVRAHVSGKTVRKQFWVPNRLINLVVG